jgi:hypothetical protein
MSTLINLPVLCTSISLPKRLKSGKKSAEIKEWDSETNGYWLHIYDLAIVTIMARVVMRNKRAEL